jgi:HK97 family phage prohead protease
MVKETEIRQLTTEIELRAAEGDTEGNYIEGYALKFNRWSDVLYGYFREMIDPTALDDCDMSNVVATFNHSANFPLARNTINDGEGSLQLNVDGIGLHFRFKPTNTSYGQDLIENIRSGLINQCSFAFGLDYNDETADEWNYISDEGIYERKLNKIAKISDISLVTTPAYPDTEAVLGRSKDKVEKLEEIRKKKDSLPKQKLLLELDLLEL